MSQMLKSMTSEEISEWQAYFNLRKEREEQENKNKPKGKANKKATLG